MCLCAGNRDNDHQNMIGKSLVPTPNGDNRNRVQPNAVTLLRWELPGFAGQEPKVWIRKCERVGNEQRIEIVALYLTDVAEVWYQSMVLSRGIPNWIEFKEDLISRFGEIVVSDVVEEFNKLQQIGTVDEFIWRFEDLKARMLIRNPEEIRFEVKMFKPRTLKEAVEKARMKEMAIEAARRRNRTVNRVLPAAAQEVGKASNAMVNRNGPYRLTPEVYEFRKSNHLCFRCGEKYGLGHICKTRQLNYLTGFVEKEREVDQMSVLEDMEEITIEGVVE
uniref:Retrotransposon gag domain-containing protein n=1 Tax=Solanum lycopersicum TaxID=4081 RepID=A0A3Q7FBT5_SOLLC